MSDAAAYVPGPWIGFGPNFEWPKEPPRSLFLGYKRWTNGVRNHARGAWMTPVAVIGQLDHRGLRRISESRVGRNTTTLTSRMPVSGSKLRRLYGGPPC